MGTILCPDVGEVLLLKYLVNHTAPTNVRVHLFTSNITPGESNVLSTYSSNEVSDPAYTPATLTGSSWTVGTSGGVSSASYATQDFSFSSSVSVYGAYYTNASDTSLLWVERFAVAPYNIPSGGGNIEITPVVELA